MLSLKMSAAILPAPGSSHQIQTRKQMNNDPKQTEKIDPFLRLNIIVKTLRGSNGCPWDQKQTLASLKKYLLEETEELAEAIDQGDARHICEEAGDLYFILALLMIILEEQGEFSVDNALDSICEKMERRHPHVFEMQHDTSKKLSEEQLQAQWQQIKEQENLVKK